MLAVRCTREFLNGTLFEEGTEQAEDEPEEESDCIFHDDDDTEDHEEEHVVPETGTAAAEAVVPSSTVTAEVARAERFLYRCCACGQHPPKI